MFPESVYSCSCRIKRMGCRIFLLDLRALGYTMLKQWQFPMIATETVFMKPKIQEPRMNANTRENNNRLLFKDEVYKIVGAAFEVSNTFGCGFLEAVYQEALEIEFYDNHIPFESQKKIKISYKGNILAKEYIADFVCCDSIIVEIKAIKKITEIEEAQLINYLKATQMPVGIIINFGGAKLEWKRYANTKNL